MKDKPENFAYWIFGIAFGVDLGTIKCPLLRGNKIFLFPCIYNISYSFSS